MVKRKIVSYDQTTAHDVQMRDKKEELFHRVHETFVIKVGTLFFFFPPRDLVLPFL
jgi:hypothetical protein